MMRSAVQTGNGREVWGGVDQQCADDADALSDEDSNGYSGDAYRA